MSEFRLDWRKTWPDNDTDFTAKAEGGFCRIYKTAPGAGADRWYWTASRTHQLGSGHRRTARQAAEAAELAFFSAG